jgi:hypothetical protein
LPANRHGFWASKTLLSLNVQIEAPGGFDYTGAQFDAWCKEAGFKRTQILRLAGPSSAAMAYKSIAPSRAKGGLRSALHMSVAIGPIFPDP